MTTWLSSTIGINIPVDVASELSSSNVSQILKGVREFVIKLTEQSRLDEISRMNLEALLRTSESRQKSSEVLVKKLEGELDDFKKQVDALKTHSHQEDELTTNLRRELEKAKAQEALIQGRLDRSEVEKGDLVRVLERKQTELDSLNGTYTFHAVLNL